MTQELRQELTTLNVKLKQELRDEFSNLRQEIDRRLKDTDSEMQIQKADITEAQTRVAELEEWKADTQTPPPNTWSRF